MSLCAYCGVACRETRYVPKDLLIIWWRKKENWSFGDGIARYVATVR
jgi:hypothetical protein